jgi:hypothetical protein
VPELWRHSCPCLVSAMESVRHTPLTCMVDPVNSTCCWHITFLLFIPIRFSIFYFEIGNSGYIFSLLKHDNLHCLLSGSDPLTYLLHGAESFLRS